MRGKRTIHQHLLGASAALLAICAAIAPAFANKADNTLRFAAETTMDSADPYVTPTVIGTIVADNVWDTLIYRDPETGAYKGNLATAWRWIDDKTLELDLRSRVKFHNGADFSSADVVYTLNYVSKPPNNPTSQVLVRWIDHVETVNANRVRIVAKRPFPAAIAYLAAPNVVIHPHEYHASVGPAGVNAHPIGTGPYRVTEHALGKYIRLERNPAYFSDGPKQQPSIERIEIRFIPDPQTRVAEIVSGGVDAIMSVARDQAEQLRPIAALRVASSETMRYAFLQLNTLAATPAPPLRDVRVRKAIMHAIDRETITRFLVGDRARVLHAECYPTQFGCDDRGAPRYPYDPKRAKQLLVEAGYPNGFQVELYAYRDRNQIEAVMGSLAAVGIKTRLRFLDMTAMVTARRAGKVPLYFGQYGSYTINDASASATFLHDFSTVDMNRDPELRDLLVGADSASDPDRRKAAYARALALMAERAYVMPLYSLENYYVTARDLSFKPYADEVLRFYEMSWK